MKKIIIIFLIVTLTGCFSSEKEKNITKDTEKKITLEEAINYFCENGYVTDYLKNKSNYYGLSYNASSYNGYYLDDLPSQKNLDDHTQLCPEVIDKEIKEYFESKENTFVLINKNFITLNGNSYPVTYIDNISKIDELDFFKTMCYSGITQLI